MDIKELCEAIRRSNIEWRKHTLIRLAERNIFQEVILEVILSGEREYSAVVASKLETLLKEHKAIKKKVLAPVTDFNLA